MNRVGATDQFRALRGTVQGRRRRWVRPIVSVLEDRMLLAAYTVISNADTNTGNPATGTGTLRWAINQLDANGGLSSTIAFDLPSNELTITPETAGLGPLPSITEPVDIEGQTQPNFAGKPLVVINGGSASLATGLLLAAGSSNSVIQDLVIDGFGFEGIHIYSSGDQVEGCYVGTDASGTVAVPNSSSGIDVDADGATIGGSASGDANVISGNNGYGVLIDNIDCLVEGNKIGTNAGGTAAVPNSGDGISVYSAFATIGGTASGDTNVISGNGGNGIGMVWPCLVEGNEIGTDAGGTAAVANSGDGILVLSTGATIGGTASGDANVISGNGSYGIDIDAPDCLVEGNKIGTDAGGTAAVPNYNGIYVDSLSSGATIGGTTSGDANVISGNGYRGIDIDATDCLVVGNKIGTDAGGTAAVPNSYVGLLVFSSGATIGGTASGDANVISGNGHYGVDIEADDCLVEGNKIGTDAGGTDAVRNSSVGIVVVGSGATIGGTASDDANVISGNGYADIAIDALAWWRGTRSAPMRAAPLPCRTPAMAYLSTHRVRRSAGPPRETPM